MKRAATVFTVILLLAGFNPAKADSVATLKTTTAIDTATVRLSDVFEGVPPTIDREIATAPLPGRSVTYNVKILKALAEQYRLDWQPQSVMDSATLTRNATRITTDMIRDAVLEKLKEQNLVGSLDVDFDKDRLEVNLPSTSAPDFAIDNFTYDDNSRRFRASLVAAPGTASMATLPISGRVSIKRDLPVLAHRMESGATVSKSDIAWVPTPVERIAADMITNADQIIGYELRHDTNDNQPVRMRDVIPPRLVTRGSTVIMKIETPNMMMTVQGRALQDGAKGETIRVTNTRSNRTIEGVVEAPGIVRIDTNAKLASAG